MSEMVDRLMDLLREYGRAHWRDDPQAKFLGEFSMLTPERQAQIIRATSREMVGGYYADPDVGPAVIPSA